MKELLDIICVEAGSDSEAKFSINIVVNCWRCRYCDRILIGEKTLQHFSGCQACIEEHEDRTERMKEYFERTVRNLVRRRPGR
jgi:hypothetical protein